MIGKEATVVIDDLAYGGAGVGRLDGLAVFVRGALPGETVRVQLSEVRKRYAKGVVAEVLEAAPERVLPACPLAAQCPGCVYQHLSYAAEVQAKQRQCRELLVRLGGLQALPEIALIPAPEESGYRNKVILHVDAQGRTGYVGHDHQTILPVADCPLAVAPIRTAMGSVAAQAGAYPQGDTLTFRWTPADGVRHWQGQAAPSAWLTEEVAGQCWQVPAGAFWQVNVPATPLLRAEVVRMVAACRPKNLMDLYCGSGFFSLALAPQVEYVLGVEWVGEAVRAARHNALRQKQQNAVFAQGDAGRIYPEAQAKVSGHETMVLVDPPRSGLSVRLREALLRPDGPRQILYVSCAADTLARDCRMLCAQSYGIREITVLDMFPRTAHFESLVLLERI